MKKFKQDYAISYKKRNGTFVLLSGVYFSAYSSLEAAKKAMTLYPQWFESINHDEDVLYVEAGKY